jgi:RND superfamily putative drug exporter
MRLPERGLNFLLRYRYPGLALVVLLWLSCALFLLRDQRPLTRAGSHGARHSEATRVHNLIQTHFGQRQENTLALVIRGAATPELLQQLRHWPDIVAVAEYPVRPGRHRLYTLQINPDLPSFTAEKHIPRLRAALARWSVRSGQPTWLTGQQAFLYDAAQASGRDTARTERIGLLLALLVLTFCFGSVSAALLPLLLGVTTLLETQTLIRLWGLGTTQSSLILNSMLGLGLAIDYALFMVSRYREERQQGTIETALRALYRHTARTILYSAAVMIAVLLILRLPDVDSLRGTVNGLLLVVTLAAAQAVWLLPLLLAALDPWLDRPRWLSRHILRWHSEARWRRLALRVTAAPRRYALLALVLLLLLAAPLPGLRLWEPMQTLAPAGSPSQAGFQALATEGWGGEILPVLIVIESPPERPLTAPAQLRQLYQLSREAASWPEVAAVQGMVTPYQPLERWLSLYGGYGALAGLAPEHPLLRQTPTGDLSVMYVYLRNLMDIPAAGRVLNRIQNWEQQHPGGLALSVGGAAARARSFTHEMYRHLPLMIVLILLVILGLLSLYLKSILLPLKAGVMNFLPILSAFGVLVWVFQGQAGRPGLTNIVPLTLFCLVFGLSMDYEVLILSRIDEAWQHSGEVRTAVVEGLSRSSGLITGAALILLGVFAPGIWSRSPVVQELSLGISVTILLDATLVRLLLVPALMMLMGRLNWWHPLQPGLNANTKRSQP